MHYPYDARVRPSDRRTQVGRVSVVSPPGADPLDLADDVKPHLRVDHSDEDDLITDAFKAAVNEIDAPRGWLGRSLITRTLLLTLDDLPPSVLYLPGPPVTSVSSVKYRDADDEIVTIDSGDYLTDLTAEPALLWIGDGGWPTNFADGPDVLRVEYVAGYANADAIPRAIRQWLLMRTAELYRDREPTVLNARPSVLQHADRMLDNWRVRA